MNTPSELHSLRLMLDINTHLWLMGINTTKRETNGEEITLTLPLHDAEKLETLLEAIRKIKNN